MLMSGSRRTFSAYKDERQSDLARHLAAFVIGGWGTRASDLQFAVNKAVQAFGGESFVSITDSISYHTLSGGMVCYAETEAYIRWGKEGLGSAQELLNLQADDPDLVGPKIARLCQRLCHRRNINPPLNAGVLGPTSQSWPQPQP